MKVFHCEVCGARVSLEDLRLSDPPFDEARDVIRFCRQHDPRGSAVFKPAPAAAAIPPAEGIKPRMPTPVAGIRVRAPSGSNSALKAGSGSRLGPAQPLAAKAASDAHHPAAFAAPGPAHLPEHGQHHHRHVVHHGRRRGADSMIFIWAAAGILIAIVLLVWVWARSQPKEEAAPARATTRGESGTKPSARPRPDSPPERWVAPEPSATTTAPPAPATPIAPAEPKRAPPPAPAAETIPPPAPKPAVPPEPVKPAGGEPPARLPFYMQ